eukprot:NODE_704_length_4578_cov_0.780978.p1 type:complete len:305 gc:universal NODE_704_length_4578_cov_0.780978:2237-1323(-)
MYLQCSPSQIGAIYTLCISTFLVIWSSIILHRTRKYDIPVVFANAVRVFGFLNAISPLLRSNLIELDTISFSAVFSFGMCVMVPFPTLYGYAFCNIGRKLYTKSPSNILVYLYIFFQVAFLLSTWIFAIYYLVNPLVSTDYYYPLILMVLCGLLGMFSSFIFFAIPFYEHVKKSEMIDVNPKIWRCVLWIGIVMILPCIASRAFYIASAFYQVGDCNSLVLQSLGSFFTFIVEFLLYADVPDCVLNILFKMAPKLFLGKGVDALRARQTHSGNTLNSTNQSHWRNSLHNSTSRQSMTLINKETV